MKINKVMTLVAALTMVFSITACGSNNAPSKNAEPAPSTNTTVEPVVSPEEVVELQPEEGATLIVWESKEERTFTDEMAKQFEEKYSIPVKVEEVAATDQVTKLTQDGPSGLGADIVMFPHDNLGRAAEAGLLLTNEALAKETIANNTPASIQGVTFKGELYGYPRAAETYALFYNKELVKEAPKSFDDVIEFSKTFTDKSKNRYGIMWEPGNLYFNYPFIATGGGYIFGDNGTNKDDIGINSAGALAGLQTYVKLKAALPIKSADITPDIKRSLFNAGDVAMDITGPWELAGYKKALGDKLGIAPIPTIDGKPAISLSGIKAWYVNSFTQYPNAAQLFAEFASTKEAQLLLNEKVGSIPTNNEALASDQIKNDPFVSGFAQQVINSQPMPTIPEMGNVWSPVNAAFPEIWDNGKDPKEAMDKAVQQIKDLNGGATK
ncbi:sugar ABC transporter substrate-binding protein [Paenibacillus macquariensis]|uniref:Maltodextrin-binding protein n=1 Tax=Paenibacillus macquariensis TaxID=948756 RepID=A0ABY1K9C9_9BACL|nr:maltose ABC transporter substrate-binding protein [Paenibacillus macquariensis]MEC0091590.1 maltose ABC transporter substrate-binding protein [Paenibacillus macquariensis]OAB26715.1 ABC transporter substrate-binding protein [Paenibacillus macquariensis subsp. macquariensis]SIR45166.1 carbohydrate ABC transporter substrate-binding protein, CUT1 family [Paenibacillus macquariensis]